MPYYEIQHVHQIVIYFVCVLFGAEQVCIVAIKTATVPAEAENDAMIVMTVNKSSAEGNN